MSSDISSAIVQARSLISNSHPILRAGSINNSHLGVNGSTNNRVNWTRAPMACLENDQFCSRLKSRLLICCKTTAMRLGKDRASSHRLSAWSRYRSVEPVCTTPTIMAFSRVQFIRWNPPFPYGQARERKICRAAPEIMPRRPGGSFEIGKTPMIGLIGVSSIQLKDGESRALLPDALGSLPAPWNVSPRVTH